MNKTIQVLSVLIVTGSMACLLLNDGFKETPSGSRVIIIGTSRLVNIPSGIITATKTGWLISFDAITDVNTTRGKITYFNYSPADVTGMPEEGNKSAYSALQRPLRQLFNYPKQLCKIERD